ncbi:methyltransferase family protein [Pelagibacterium sp.]|uniref:methyltransferase family protein n=1 Tax=Pelagibacterium sp. TaxID=1967288 RepID=UPI003A93CDC9
MAHDPNDSPHLPMLPPTYPVMFLVGAIACEFVVPLQFLQQPALMSWSSLVALVLVTCGLSLAVWSAFTFKVAGTHVEPMLPTLKIVTDGPYRISRNPIYLGFLLIFGGVSIGFSLEWGLVAVPILLFVLDRVVVQREEAYLTRKFGAEYTDFLARTRRWI